MTLVLLPLGAIIKNIFGDPALEKLTELTIGKTGQSQTEASNHEKLSLYLVDHHDKVEPYWELKMHTCKWQVS